MSRFRILQVDHYNPESVGRKNRIIYTIYGVIPTMIILAFNMGQFFGMGYINRLIISVPVLVLIYFILLKKVRSNINNLKSIGEIEITQTCLKKRLGDSFTEYPFQSIKEIKLIKHIPATRIRESKSRYFSYILKINFYNKPEELLVVSDRSVDHNQKISLADTMKTLKKIVPFNVIMEL
jgi:hypothetical protein